VPTGSKSNLLPEVGERDVNGRKLRPQCEECQAAGKERVPHGKFHSAKALAAESARIASAHRDAHATAGARGSGGSPAGLVIDERAAAVAKRQAEAHLAAAQRAQEVEEAVNAPVPFEAELRLDQEQLAKRQRPRRGYALDTEEGWWREADIVEAVGTGHFTAKFDNHQPPSESGISPQRIVADGDKLFVTWEDAADYMEVRISFALSPFLAVACRGCSFVPDAVSSCAPQESIIEATVDVRDQVVLHLVNPSPQADAWEGESFILNLNHTRRSRWSAQPTAWAHSVPALKARLDAMASE
jgi:hypothetical protein